MGERLGRKWQVQLATHDLKILKVVHVGSRVDESTAQERVSGGGHVNSTPFQIYLNRVLQTHALLRSTY